MATRTQEARRQRIPEIHFKPEGYAPRDSQEYLDQLLEMLKNQGFDTKNLLFSGVSADELFLPDGAVPEAQAVFAMNQTGWEETIRHHQLTPAGYTDDEEKQPCILLYDATDMQEARNYQLHQPGGISRDDMEFKKEGDGHGLYDFSDQAAGDDSVGQGFDLDAYHEPVQVRDIKEVFSDITPEASFTEVAVSKNFPDAPATDALVGLVYLDQD